jgi:hypothetical protein
MTDSRRNRSIPANRRAAFFDKVANVPSFIVTVLCRDGAGTVRETKTCF